jgi:hypothetical protein
MLTIPQFGSGNSKKTNKLKRAAIKTAIAVTTRLQKYIPVYRLKIKKTKVNVWSEFSIAVAASATYTYAEVEEVVLAEPVAIMGCLKELMQISDFRIRHRRRTGTMQDMRSLR